MIEILKEDNINENKFLNPDLKYKNDYNSYLNYYFYLVGLLKIIQQKFLLGRYLKY